MSVTTFAGKAVKKSVDLLKEFFFPGELYIDPDSFTTEQIRALSDRKTISKMLFYRSYIETDDGYGFYMQADGRIGVIFEVTPPPYLTEDMENNIISVLNAVMLDETILHIMTFASRNITKQINRYKAIHSAPAKIKYPDILKKYSDDITKYFQKWTSESISGKESDLRIRSFRHTVSILFPYDTDEFVIKQQYNQIKGILRDIHARNMPAEEFVALMREIFNPSRNDYLPSKDPITNLNKQIARGAAIKLDDKKGLLELNDGWKARVLTTDKFPYEMSAFNFQELFFDTMGNDFQISLPCPFMVSLVIRFRNIEKQKKWTLAKARWNLGMLSGLPYIIYKKYPHIKERRDENEDVIKYINELGEIPLDAMWSLTIFENNEKKLDEYTAVIKKRFESAVGRWILKEEKFPNIALLVFLQSLPLQYSEIIHANIDKFEKNFKSNNAQIVPLILHSPNT